MSLIENLCRRVIKRKIGHVNGIALRLDDHVVFVRLQPHTSSWVKLEVLAPPEVEILLEEELVLA